MSKFETVKITGKGAWVKVHNPVLKYRSKTDYHYELELSLTDKAIQAVRKLDNLPDDKQRTIRSHDGLEGKFMRFTRPVLSKIGKTLPPLKVVDDEGEAFKESIGNGSLVEVFFTLIPMEGDQTIIRPHKVKVLELISYTADDKDDEVQELGGGKVTKKSKPKVQELGDDEDEEF